MGGGGSWLVQNKVRPGAYINFKSRPKPLGTLSDRGVVTLPLFLPWGPEKQIIVINAEDKLFDVLGIDILDPAALLIKEALKRANKFLLYRVNTGKKAMATADLLTINALYSGSKGNDITVVIQPNIDNPSKFDVLTLVQEEEIDKQSNVTKIEDLKENKFIEFKGTGDLKATAGIPLKGGEDGTATNLDYTDYLAAAELYDFNTMALPLKDPALKSVFVSFIKRLREREGKKVQCVLENYPLADYEGIISVKNGVILSDLTIISSDKAVAWVAGATAGANVNESLTYTRYDDAIDVDTKYMNSDIEDALRHGEFLFTVNNEKVGVEQDINSFISFTVDKGKEFRKNRPLRVLDSIGNDIKRIFAAYYTGKEDNNDDGRNLFKKEVIRYMETLQGINAIQNFSAKDDIEVLPSEEEDAVVVNVGVQPVDAMEKLYMTVEVR